ncbi:MAG: hypothetical protein U5R30_12755 [Deltaproteobacteria bacterium]|nr:hypothetical protein [Deltaproteobacteria bacterium]
MGFLAALFKAAPKKTFTVLNPDILTDWQKRFEISGQTKSQEAWNELFKRKYP